VGKIIDQRSSSVGDAVLSGRAWIRRLRPRPRRLHQRVFRFLHRAARLERIFKMTVAVATAGLMAIVLAALPTGRYAASWLSTRARWLALGAVGLAPDRAEIDADWRRKRLFDIQQASGKLPATFAEYTPEQQRLVRFAGLDPEHALVRWGNFDRTVLLPSTVFEIDESGRSYRFRPNTRSIWVRNFPVKGQMKAYFQAPDRPELPELVRGTGTVIVEGSTQTTNSWGLRGPEPDVTATYRGIVLGDSYMQGLFVADDETPTECLKRELRYRLAASVGILNTGHLGYSPEQYYFSLVEFAQRFPPQFVVVSVFANDFGDYQEVLQGRGDWEEAKYWLDRIQSFCFARGILYLIVPAPWVNQIENPRMAAFYPGAVSNILGSTGFEYLDPTDAFADAQLDAVNEALRQGTPFTGSPLFNGRIGDGHFSASGSEVWARAVSIRLSLMIEARLKAVKIPRIRHDNGQLTHGSNSSPSVVDWPRRR
jgi:hypothetical protein